MDAEKYPKIGRVRVDVGGPFLLRVVRPQVIVQQVVPVPELAGFGVHIIMVYRVKDRVRLLRQPEERVHLPAAVFVHSRAYRPYHTATA